MGRTAFRILHPSSIERCDGNELRMIEQAIRNDWDITPQGKENAIKLIDEVLNDPNATSRESVLAAELVLLINPQPTHKRI